MLTCPNCEIPLKKTGNRFGIFWACSSCCGRAVTFEVIRKVIPRLITNKLWQRARSGDYPHKRKCPGCKHLMIEVPIINAEKTEYIDVCLVCHFVWFDTNEYDVLPKIAVKEPEGSNLAPEAREALALAQLEQLKQEQEAKQIGCSAPDHWWELMPAIFGLPVEYNRIQLKHKPLLTWSLSVFIAIVSVAALFNLEDTIRDWGLIPAEFSRYFGLTFISSFFLHGGIFHLVSNLYFLLVFGDNVEDVLEKWRYPLLIFSALIIGGIVHVVADPASNIPCIGASGGISGIITYYALKFPKTQIGLIFFFRWVRLPVLYAFFIWMIMQFFGVYLQLEGVSNVSALAHLGGVATGFAFWLKNRSLYKN